MDDRKHRILELAREIEALEATQVQRLCAIDEQVRRAETTIVSLRNEIVGVELQLGTLASERARIASKADIHEKSSSLDLLLAAPVNTPVLDPTLPADFRRGKVWYPKAMRGTKYHACRIEEIQACGLRCLVSYLDEKGEVTGERVVLIASFIRSHCSSLGEALKAVRPDYRQRCQECGHHMLDIEIALSFTAATLAQSPKNIDGHLKGRLTGIPRGSVQHTLGDRTTWFKLVGKGLYEITAEGRAMAAKHLAHAPKGETKSDDGVLTTKAIVESWRLNFGGGKRDLRAWMTPKVVQTDKGPAVLIPSCKMGTFEWLAIVDDHMPEKHPHILDRKDLKVDGGDGGHIWLKFVHLNEGMVIAGATRDARGEKDFEKWYKVQDGQLVEINLAEYLQRRPKPMPNGFSHSLNTN